MPTASPQASASARYQLGDVQPHVRRAADHFGPAHGISSIGGWRATGSVPNSDHPKGLALDFMTRSKSRGDQLATDLTTNGAAWGVRYVIWWRQIWHPGSGWKPYSGPSPHTDHVHASFKETPGDGQSLPGRVIDAVVPDTITGGIKYVGDQLGDVAKTFASIGKVAELLTAFWLPTNIVRGAAALSGAVFVLLGVWFLSREVRNS